MDYLALLSHIHTQLQEAADILGIKYTSASPEEQSLIKDLAQVTPSNLDWFIRVQQPTGWTGNTP
jgi:hypothetical protein